jgi:hypothetical protein
MSHLDLQLGQLISNQHKAMAEIGIFFSTEQGYIQSFFNMANNRVDAVYKVMSCDQFVKINSTVGE